MSNQVFIVSIALLLVSGCSQKLTWIAPQNEAYFYKLENKSIRSLYYDSDHDGIKDWHDQCADAHLGLSVNNSGCEIDSDGDGVPNLLDVCPNQAASERACGCPIPVRVVILFDKNHHAAAIGKQKAKSDLSKFITNIISNNCEVRIAVDGFTDNSGSRAANEKLSLRRANYIADLLIEEGIEPEQLKVSGIANRISESAEKVDSNNKYDRRVDVYLLPSHQPNRITANLSGEQS